MGGKSLERDYDLGDLVSAKIESNKIKSILEGTKNAYMRDGFSEENWIYI